MILAFPPSSLIFIFDFSFHLPDANPKRSKKKKTYEFKLTCCFKMQEIISHPN